MYMPLLSLGLLFGILIVYQLLLMPYRSRPRILQLASRITTLLCLLLLFLLLAPLCRCLGLKVHPHYPMKLHLQLLWLFLDFLRMPLFAYTSLGVSGLWCLSLPQIHWSFGTLSLVFPLYSCHILFFQLG
ncbi:MAG: hypothetical protein AMQ74_01667 [Candidatus Methanofastidiosum methylothiophilum]|uniref:Uncharacterized protein n=1 Tax=Candidatus Methanofastidiosum methylothiophilum TaxID=1705564 RepID=A0A150IRN6_9EURY|nr:MAG: hypothetical protein AMQ74_01667 [Candidatus Methanofastidiosum methylthiophilus]